jgi:hypothetical protein
MDIQSFINNINWTTPSWDLFIIIIFVAGIFLYGLSLGRDRAFIILISSYISLALLNKSSLIFEVLGIQLDNSFMNNTALFLGGVFVLFFLLSNSAFTSVFDQSPAGTWMQTLIVSFLQIGLVISIVISFLPPEEINALSSFIKSVFVENQAQFFWLLSPLVSMLIFKGR